jgi:hypothetical protein
MVSLARQHRPRPTHRRRHHHRPGDAQPQRRANQTAQGRARVRQLPARQRRAHPQLRRTPPRRRGHLHRVHRVRGQPGLSKRMVKKHTDALDPTRCPPATSNPHPSPQRPTRRRLPPLVSRIHPLDLGSGHTGRSAVSRVAPTVCPALHEGALLVDLTDTGHFHLGWLGWGMRWQAQLIVPNHEQAVGAP